MLRDRRTRGPQLQGGGRELGSMLEGGCSDRVREATWTMFQVLCSFDFKHHEELLGTLSKYLISLLWRVRKSFGHLFSNIYFHGTGFGSPCNFLCKGSRAFVLWNNFARVLQNFRIPLLDGKNLFIGQMHVFVKMMFIFYKRNQEIPCHMSL